MGICSDKDIIFGRVGTQMRRSSVISYSYLMYLCLMEPVQLNLREALVADDFCNGYKRMAITTGNA